LTDILKIQDKNNYRYYYITSV